MGPNHKAQEKTLKNAIRLSLFLFDTNIHATVKPMTKPQKARATQGSKPATAGFSIHLHKKFLPRNGADPG